MDTMERTRITVVGLGYVGMASAVLLAQRHDVVALEIDPERAALVNDGRSPIEDPDISEFLGRGGLSLRARRRTRPRPTRVRSSSSSPAR